MEEVKLVRSYAPSPGNMTKSIRVLKAGTLGLPRLMHNESGFEVRDAVGEKNVKIRNARNRALISIGFILPTDYFSQPKV